MKVKKETSPIISTITENLINLIEQGNAHTTLRKALQDIPFSILGG